MFALVDCNNFYASCERLFRPDLNNKPIVVLSNNDGCVIARSNEAKALGIPMGAVAFKYKHLFKQDNVHVFSSNYSLYGDLSERVFNTYLKLYSPDVEIYSIDEAFFKLDGFDYFDIRKHSIDVKTKVEKWTSIPTSIGIAQTKSLSKVANRIAKKYPSQTKGVHIIDTEQKRIKALKWLDIDDVWGIGKRYATKLKSHQINNAYQFTNLPQAWVKKEMSIVGIRLQRDLQGKPTLDLEEVKSKKMIATTRSFAKDLSDFDSVRERVSTFAVECAKKLRKQNCYCGHLIVFVTTNRHRKEDKQYSRSIVVNLPYVSNSNNTINAYAVGGLSKIFKKGFKYKKAGVIVGNITPMSSVQMTLFGNENPKLQTLMSTIDKVNTRFHKDIIKLGSQNPSRKWIMKQENLSPNYTTRLNEIIEIK